MHKQLSTFYFREIVLRMFKKLFTGDHMSPLNK